MRGDRIAPALALTALAAIFPAAVLRLVWPEQVALPGMLHFAGVGGAALLAAAAAVALSVAGARTRDPRAVLVGTAFSVMAGLLVVHGLATPGVLVGPNGVVAFSGAATLPAGAAVLSLSLVPALRGEKGVRRLLMLQGVLLAGVIALAVAALAAPDLVPGVPRPAGSAAVSLFIAAAALYALLAIRALRTFLLARRRGDLVVVVGLAWLGSALATALLLTYLDLGWWIGHFLEVIGIGIVAAPVVLDLRRAAPSLPLAGGIGGADLVMRAEAFLGADVRLLTRRLAEKDESTEEHTRRVALLAVQVGEELGLPRSRLRTLAIGALLHDVGKLSIPDGILQKPGPLDDHERDVIRMHPLRGERLLGELGFSSKVRRLVVEHHERLDGKGYPRGLGTRTLGFDTKILTVSDVYDALISERVYRAAWTPAQAIRFLREQTGWAFDPRCVEALERVLEREHGLRPAESA